MLELIMIVSTAFQKDQWRDKINEFGAQINLQIMKPGAVLQVVLRDSPPDSPIHSEIDSRALEDIDNSSSSRQTL